LIKPSKGTHKGGVQLGPECFNEARGAAQEQLSHSRGSTCDLIRLVVHETVHWYPAGVLDDANQSVLLGPGQDGRPCDV